MKNIRQKVFETNSSSTHSISISNVTNGVYDTIIPDKKGNIYLTGGEFGWEEESYTDPTIKAIYCAIDIKADIADTSTQVNKHKKMLTKVICEHTGAKKVIFDFSTDYNAKKYSYIDHQSEGTSLEAFASEKALKDFIFGPESVLTTDNDNH